MFGSVIQDFTSENLRLYALAGIAVELFKEIVNELRERFEKGEIDEDFRSFIYTPCKLEVTVRKQGDRITARESGLLDGLFLAVDGKYDEFVQTLRATSGFLRFARGVCT